MRRDLVAFNSSNHKTFPKYKKVMRLNGYWKMLKAIYTGVDTFRNAP